MLLHATMIAGLAAVVLPLVLSRLQRARVRRLEWGAMMFLEPIGRATFSSTHRAWLLTATRMGLIACLAFALAEPVPADAPALRGAGLTVLVIDRSGSMSVSDAGKSRLDAARHVALDVLAALPSGEEAAVIFSPESFGSGVTSDLQQVAARISDVRQSNGRADLAAALATAARLMQSSRSGRRNLFLIGDTQAISWRDMTEAFADTWRAELGATTPFPPTLSFIPIGSPTANAAILSGDPSDPQILAGKPFTVELRLGNYSAAARSVVLTLSLGAQVVDTSTQDLSANATQSIRRTLTLSEVGSQLITAKLNDDALSGDDSLEIGVLVQPSELPPRPAPDQNLSPGDPIIADLPGASPDHITIEGPTNNSSVDVAAMPTGVQARYSATGRAGVYRLHYNSSSGPQVLHFVVRGSHEESDVTDLSRNDLNRNLYRFGFQRLNDPTPAALARLIRPAPIEASTLLLSAAAALAVLEVALSRWWLFVGAIK